MDLLCDESVCSSGGASSAEEPRMLPLERHVRKAIVDPALSNDRVLENTLKAEERHGPPATSYFGTVQKEITTEMRKIVAKWMLEVCLEQQCQEEVFCLAVKYLDGFLSVCPIRKTQLQLLGSACLLLASKLREPNAKNLPVDMLVFYTDNSITPEELCKWELLVLLKLKWDMAAVTPQDFLALLVARLPIKPFVEPEMVIKHAQTFVALAIREYHFTAYTASTMASACIAVALNGLDWCSQSGITVQELLAMLHQITHVEQDFLQNCLEQIEQMLNNIIEESKCDPNGLAGAAAETDPMERNWSQPQTVQEKGMDNARTPTDIRDVHF